MVRVERNACLRAAVLIHGVHLNGRKYLNLIMQRVLGCRYTWDDEIGAHDVEVELDESGGASVPMTSEELPFEMFRLVGRSDCVCVLFWRICSVPCRNTVLKLIFNVSDDL